MSANRKVTLPKLLKMKGKEQISMITCYDYTFARLVEQSEIDSILVGDSLGMVVKGDADTLSVSLEEMVYHVKAVRRGAPTPFLIADMPFGSYQSSVEQGVQSAVTLLKAGAEAVKIEGGKEVEPLVRRLSEYGIPVVSHIGMTPQYYHTFGGFVKQAKSEKDREKLTESAIVLEDAGAQLFVLESVPEKAAEQVCAAVRHAPVIGIGAGTGVDGQVLVIYDVLGLNQSFVPSFVTQYASLETEVVSALRSYRDATKR